VPQRQQLGQFLVDRGAQVLAPATVSLIEQLGEPFRPASVP
jgi:hypothetical protein